MKGNYQTDKTTGLYINLLVYAGAFGAALVPFSLIQNLLLAELAFTVTATVIIYVISFFIEDTSLYDPYWSVAPPVMLIIAMLRENYFHKNGLLFLLAVCIWSLRLTLNWMNTYKGVGREDWRYADFRKKLKKLPFELLNFFGFMLMPTLVTYAGLVSGFYIIADARLQVVTIPGIAIMLLGVVLEHLSDKALHDYLGKNTGTRLTCREGIWKYSRHPNYLGEMTFWTGIFISHYSMFADKWQRGLGFVLIICVFVFASIPLMEAHNMERRRDYAEYMKVTSVLFPLPPKGNIGWS